MRLNAIITLLKNMSRIKLYTCLSLLAVLTACGSSGCYDQTEVKMRGNLYLLSEADKITLDSVSVWGIGSDSLIYQYASVSQLALPLNPSKEESQFVFQVISDGHAYKDTLLIIHSNRPWFESMDCDCMMFSHIDTCMTTGQLIRSISILEHEIINNDAVHVLFNL